MRTTAIARLVGLSLLALVLCAVSVAAQVTTGSIQGVVTDSQGGAIPGATVTIRNVDTDVSRSLATDVEGNYRFLNLPVGNYELVVELAGFGRHVRAGLTLALNQTAVVDVQLSPAALSELVSVTCGRTAHQHHECGGGCPLRHPSALRSCL